MTIRKPVVAGSFYPSSEQGLTSLLHSILKTEKEKIDEFPENCKVIGAVVPHAGYVYSGYEAMHFFAPLATYPEQIDTIVIINPDHSGMGNDVAIDNHDQWETPFGKVDIDTDFANLMKIEVSDLPHNEEHAAEVMLPFLQYFLKKEFKIVPISITKQTPEIALMLAKNLYNASLQAQKNIIIIASSDFSHYIAPHEGFEKDTLALKQILNFDSQKLYEVIKKNNISVCGYGSIMTLIEYSKLVTSSPKTKVLARGNSGKAGNEKRVVDYNTILFYEN